MPDARDRKWLHCDCQEFGQGWGSHSPPGEYEISLPEIQPVWDWPESEVREKVLALAEGAELEPIFDLSQSRIVRPVAKGDRLVAEFSLDDVGLVIGRDTQQYYELEVELKVAGTEEDLVVIASALRNEWELQPESRSKFERALVAIGEAEAPAQILTQEEKAVFLQLANRNDLHGKRAVALMALDAGELQETAGQLSGLSTRRVRYWLAEFRKRRMQVFPERVLQSIGMKAEAISPAPQADAATRAGVQPWSVDILMEHYDVDRTHARTVVGFALTLFDDLGWVHQLPASWRSLLETAALLHDIGVSSDLDRHDVVGRDILLQHPPAGLDEQEQQIVATATWLHRRPISSKNLGKLKKKGLAGLPEPVQLQSLKMIALLRIADGLDYSEGSGELGRVYQEAGSVHLEVCGPFASVDIGRAEEKSDLWRLLFDVPLQYEAVKRKAGVSRLPLVSQNSIGAQAKPPATEAKDAEATSSGEVVEPAKADDTPGLEPDDSMAEAARKTFRFHFERMLMHEPGTRLGEDVEELHDMRVATRRMRAAVGVFEDYLDLRQLKPFIKGMRRTGRALGAVRDLDVFAEKTETYIKTLPVSRRGELESLMRVWAVQRDVKREQMLAYLDSSDYSRFVQEFGDFLNKPGAGALPVSNIGVDGPKPHRLRHVVPIAVYQRMAEVRAYDEWMEGPSVPLERYHQLRIASKGLRYTLEYFREILAPEAKQAIDDVKALQDVLGDLHDAVVACNLLRDFLTWGTWGHDTSLAPGPGDLIVAPGPAAYLAARQMELQDLLQQFPSVWARFHGQKFSQKVTAAVVVL